MNASTLVPAMTVGSIGCGNMGGAVLAGLASLPQLTLLAHDHNAEKIRALGPKVQACEVLRDLVQTSDVLVLAVKPHTVGALLAQIAPWLGSQQTVVSMAAGISLASLRQGIGGVCPVVRVMPNTPALVGHGTFALCFDDPALPETRQVTLSALFATLGRVMALPEAKFGAFTAFVGSGPGYVFYFMDAMVEAGVTLGFTRQQAADMAAYLFEGSAKLAVHTKTAPATLREQVCSPAGVTLAGTNSLDRQAVRGLIVEAVQAAFEREKAMQQ